MDKPDIASIINLFTWILAVYFSRVFLISRTPRCRVLMASSSSDFSSSYCTTLLESFCSCDSILLTCTKMRHDHLFSVTATNQSKISFMCSTVTSKNTGRKWSENLNTCYSWTERGSRLLEISTVTVKNKRSTRKKK